MSRLNNIEKLRGWCHKILPLVYDDSLSYYEVLCKVRSKLNEVIDLTDEQNEVIEEMVQEISNWESTTDGKYDEFVQLMDGKFDTFTNTVNQNFENYEEQINQEFDDFVHLFVDEFDRNTPYSVGDYVEYEDQIYKCTALPSPLHAVPIDFDEYTWLRISQGVISQFSREMMAMDGDIKEFVERMVPLYSENEYYNKDMVVRTPSVFAPSFPYDFYIAKQLIEPEPWTPAHWERVNSFAQAINDVCAINKYEMQEQFDQFLEDYQRQFGVVQDRGTSTTDVMSQKAVSDELEAHDESIDKLLSDLAPDYDETADYKIGNLLSASGKMYLTIKDAPAGTPVTNTEYFEEKSVADIIEMIKQGAIVTGHSQVADNLTPYSEDSGIVQSNPYISQGTGTDNNSVIVTTGNIAKQLEKQGNTIVKNQKWNTWLNTRTSNGITITKNGDGDFTLNGTSTYSGEQTFFDESLKYADTPIISGHKYLWGTISGIPNGVNMFISNFGSYVTIQSGVYAITTASVTQGAAPFILRIAKDASFSNARIKDIICVDLTQLFNGNDNIPADLLANPSHFSWYYNGSLAYDAGSLANCNGRYLECGQGRNLWDEEWELGYIDNNGQKQSSSSNICSKNFCNIIPNISGYAKISTTGNVDICFYDKDYNYIGRKTIYKAYASAVSEYNVFETPSNAEWFKLSFENSYGTTYKHDITISLYYTPEQGGEGYDQYYPYVAPIRIDTGNEPLKAFDKKLPNGVIEHNTEEYTFTGNEAWAKGTYGPITLFYFVMSEYKWDVSLISTQKAYVSNGYTKGHGSFYGIDNKQFNMSATLQNNAFFIRDDSISTVDEVKAKFPAGTKLQYPVSSANQTTEQGTPFSEYAPINDYSYMAWFDTDGNLVSIPQGCKLFYPVDYKGFTDDLVMYTNGDATALAKNEDITDTALNARGYYKLQDLSSGITDNAGLTYTTKKVYKIGDVVFMTLTAKNETGSTIASGTTLFTVGSGLVPSADVRPSITLRVNSINTETNLRIMSGTGATLVNNELEDGCLIYIAVSYAV